MTTTPIPFSMLSRAQVKDIHRTIELRHTFLLPSVVYLWFNYENKAVGFHNDTFSLGYLFPSVGENFFCLSSNGALNNAQLLNVRKLISDEAVTVVRHSTFSLVQDADQQTDDYTIEGDDPALYDYIYSLSELSACEGKKFEDTRRHIRRFFDLYRTGLKIQTIDGWAAISEYRSEALELFDDWTHYATEGSATFHEELRALELFFVSDPSQFFGNIVSTLFFYKDKLVGYSINEIIDEKIVVNHFHKANLNLSSIGHYMFYSVAKILADRGIQYLNFQDDYGIGGLRAFKRKMRPIEVFETKKVTFLTQ